MIRALVAALPDEERCALLAEHGRYAIGGSPDETLIAWATAHPDLFLSSLAARPSRLALAFGCDDVEGTVVYERIYHEAGAQTDMQLPYLEIVALIRGAGRRPVERDSLYQAVRETFDEPPPQEPAVRRGASLPVVHAA